MPSITSKKLLKFLKGSYIVLKSLKDATKRVTLPMHNKDLKPGTLSSVLKQAGINKKELSVKPPA